MFKALAFIIFETQEIYATDEMLVQAVKEGDEAAFETLVARLRVMIYHSIVRYQSYVNDDWYQEALILLYQTALTYDREKCDQFRPYYLKILKFRLIDRIRKESKSKFDIVSIDEPVGEEKNRALKEEIYDPLMMTPEVNSVYNDLIQSINPVTFGLSQMEYRLVKHLMARLSLKEICVKENKDERVIRNAVNRLKQKMLSHLMR